MRRHEGVLDILTTVVGSALVVLLTLMWLGVAVVVLLTLHDALQAP